MKKINLFPYQQVGVDFALASDRNVLIADSPGLGKALPCSLPVPGVYTNFTMGDVSVGTKLIGSTGQPVRVTGVYPQGVMELYDMNFIDCTIPCTLEHIWTVFLYEQEKFRKVDATTSELIILLDKVNSSHISIPTLSSPAERKGATVKADIDSFRVGEGIRKERPILSSREADMVFEIYTKDYPAAHRIEFLKGMSGTTGNEIRNWEILREDVETIHRMVGSLGGVMYIHSESSSDGKKTLVDIDFPNFPTSENVLGSNEATLPYISIPTLSSPVGCIPHISAGLDPFCRGKKFRENLAEVDSSVSDQIFDDYMKSPPSHRMAFFKGMSGEMGNEIRDWEIPCEEVGKIHRMASSLGGVMRLHLESSSDGGEKLLADVDFPHDGKVVIRPLLSITKTGRSEECVCIEVDAPDSLFCVGHYVLTHNTVQGIGVAQKKKRAIQNPKH